MIRSMDEILRTVPVGLTEASYALGSNKSETAFRIFTRQTVSGINHGDIASLSEGGSGCRFRPFYSRV